MPLLKQISRTTWDALASEPSSRATLNVLRGRFVSGYQRYFIAKNRIIPVGATAHKWRLIRPAAPLAGSRILDVGCSSGFFSFAALHHKAESVIAVDTDNSAQEQNRRFAREIDTGDRVEFVTADAVEYCVANQRSCDLVLALSIVHRLSAHDDTSVRDVLHLLSATTSSSMVVEFIPFEDRTAPEVFDTMSPSTRATHTLPNFLAALGACFKQVIYLGESAQPGRLLFLGVGKSDSIES